MSSFVNDNADLPAPPGKPPLVSGAINSGGPQAPGKDGAQQPVARPLRSAAFRKGREQGWKTLDDMVSRVEAGGISTLSATEVARLPLLYRSVMSSLSVARGIALDRNLLLYLESLSLRAYLAVYGPRSGVLENLRAFLGGGFSVAVRAMRCHLALAFIVLMVGIAAGFILTHSDINYFSILVPQDLAADRGPGSSREDLLAGELFAPWPGFVESFVVFASSLFRHNAIVGILSFGLGFALGLPTLFLLLYNGLTIGAFVALHTARGLTVDCIGWLSIHGVTELLAVLLCSAAGLVVAQSILFPGELPRLANLAARGRSAASVAAGAVGLFFIAGFLEGGFRQLIASTPGRYAFALLTAVLWFAYFGLLGRRQRHDHTK